MYQNRAFDGDRVVVQLLSPSELETELARLGERKVGKQDINDARNQKCEIGAEDSEDAEPAQEQIRLTEEDAGKLDYFIFQPKIKGKPTCMARLSTFLSANQII